MENIKQVLKHIRQEKRNASSRTIMTLLNTTMDVANELIDYLYDAGFIHKPIKRADGNRTNLKLTSMGMDEIVSLK